MKTLTIAIASVLTVGIGNAYAIDPLATEVASQTWYSMSDQTKDFYCNKRNDNKAAKAIVKRYNSEATPSGKAQLKKAYKVIFSNC